MKFIKLILRITYIYSSNMNKIIFCQFFILILLKIIIIFFEIFTDIGKIDWHFHY